MNHIKKYYKKLKDSRNTNYYKEVCGTDEYGNYKVTIAYSHESYERSVFNGSKKYFATDKQKYNEKLTIKG